MVEVKNPSLSFSPTFLPTAQSYQGRAAEDLLFGDLPSIVSRNDDIKFHLSMSEVVIGYWMVLWLRY
jgi:hypothetical protein